MSSLLRQLFHTSTHGSSKRVDGLDRYWQLEFEVNAADMLGWEGVKMCRHVGTGVVLYLLWDGRADLYM